ncbi:hypothetical protein A2V82_04525 [candidate division KSB1 bacterium RBG_16_48_16]|nr:MAG: hypothetical protein A2V82_04525 [candidate division KSB1 bacterium RBG_16_48_16]
MIKILLLIVLFTLATTPLIAQEVIIQENETGFCSVDGAVMTSVAGYTGSGYADTDRGVGKSMSWNVKAVSPGTVSITWRYGNGGGSGDRPARLKINGVTIIESVNFPHTGTWTNWLENDPVKVDLFTGNNKIRIEAHSVDGLVNVDYIKITGTGVAASECLPSYSLTVNRNDEAGGTVSFEPVQELYDEGTEITLRAHASPGYFFQSWSGDVTSADSVFTFAIQRNTVATAIFLPEGTVMDPNIIGYATIQDDEGTPYLVTGGALGDTVAAESYEELQDYLARPEPYVVTLSNKIVGTQDLKVSSHKTLLGLTDTAHLQGIEVEINGARNVIVRNMKISHVTPADAIVITGKSQNIWIDHCELFSDRDHGQDYYDGLLDIKNESSFITVSWCVFHDHFKTSLISSGDQAVADSVIRATWHHNYFYNCDSRLPSIRFGKAHVFNNYFKNCVSAINSRMGACVRVERNYFHNVGTAVMMANSPEKGSVELIDNFFGTSGVSTSPTCQLDVPYPYEEFLDETNELPLIIAGEAVAAVYADGEPPRLFSMSNYPNPFNAGTSITFTLPLAEHVRLTILNILGQEVAVLVDKKIDSGQHTIHWDADGLGGGIYLYRMRTDRFVESRKMILLK